MLTLESSAHSYQFYTFDRYRPQMPDSKPPAIQKLESPTTTRAKVKHLIKHHRGELVVGGLGALAPLTVFAALGEDIASGEPLRFDRSILEWLHAQATPALDQVMLFITNIGGEIGLTALIAVLLLGLSLLRRWRDAFFVFLAVGGSEAFNLMLKALFGRPRPSLWTSISPETSFSFPSGHATGSVALAAALLVLLWSTRWRVPALLIGALFGTLVSLSRLYLGVHYPSDVLAGAAASLAWVTLLILTLRRELFTAWDNTPAPVAASAHDA